MDGKLLNRAYYEAIGYSDTNANANKSVMANSGTRTIVQNDKTKYDWAKEENADFIFSLLFIATGLCMEEHQEQQLLLEAKSTHCSVKPW